MVPQEETTAPDALTPEADAAEPPPPPVRTSETPPTLPEEIRRLPVRDDPDNGPGIHHNDVARLFGVKPPTLRQMRSDGDLGDPDYRVGKVPYYRPQTVAYWYRRRHPETVLSQFTADALQTAPERESGVRNSVNQMEKALTLIADSMKRADNRDDQMTQLTETTRLQAVQIGQLLEENRRLREALSKRQLSVKERLTGRIDE